MKKYTQRTISSRDAPRMVVGVLQLSFQLEKRRIYYIIQSIHLQILVSGKTTNYERIRMKIKNMSNPTSMSAVVKQLLDEAYGDVTLSQDICFKHMINADEQGQHCHDFNEED